MTRGMFQFHVGISLIAFGKQSYYWLCQRRSRAMGPLKYYRGFFCLLLLGLFENVSLGHKRPRVIPVGTTLGPNFHRKEGIRELEIKVTMSDLQPAHCPMLEPCGTLQWESSSLLKPYQPRTLSHETRGCARIGLKSGKGSGAPL